MTAAEVSKDTAIGSLIRMYVAKIMIADRMVDSFAEGLSSSLWL